MKSFLVIILLFILLNCSFDNKTGIWNNSNVSNAKLEKYKDFKKFYLDKKLFDEIINPPDNFRFSTSNIKTNESWTDEFYQESNNFYNFSYKSLNELIFKSKRISRHTLNKKFLFY